MVPAFVERQALVAGAVGRDGLVGQSGRLFVKQLLQKWSKEVHQPSLYIYIYIYVYHQLVHRTKDIFLDIHKFMTLSEQGDQQPFPFRDRLQPRRV